MNWTILIPIIAQYGIPLAEKLFSLWTSGAVPTQADFDALRALMSETAADRATLDLQGMGEDISQGIGKAILELAGKAFPELATATKVIPIPPDTGGDVDSQPPGSVGKTVSIVQTPSVPVAVPDALLTPPPDAVLPPASPPPPFSVLPDPLHPS